MAKVPHGKVVYIGARKYQAGDEIPDGILDRAEGAAGARAPARRSASTEKSGRRRSVDSEKAKVSSDSDENKP